MLRVERVGTVAIVRVHGDVDIASAPQFEAALALLRDETVVVVDLEVCRYFDSTGFSVLYRAIRNHHVIVCMPDDCAIRRLFEIVGAGQLFPIFATDAAAIQAARKIEADGEPRTFDDGRHAKSTARDEK